MILRLGYEVSPITYRLAVRYLTGEAAVWIMLLPQNEGLLFYIGRVKT